MLMRFSHFDHIQPADKGDLVQGLRRNYPIDAYPKDLHNKVYLLKHFESYMSDRLYGDQEYTFKDTALTNGMVFVQRYLRMKHVILFRLSNDILQVGRAMLEFSALLLLNPSSPHSSRHFIPSSPHPSCLFGVHAVSPDLPSDGTIARC